MRHSRAQNVAVVAICRPFVAGPVARIAIVAAPFRSSVGATAERRVATVGDSLRRTETRRFRAAFVANCRRDCRHRQGGGNGDKSDTSFRCVALSPPMPLKLPFALNAQSECCESRGSAPAPFADVAERDPLPTARAQQATCSAPAPLSGNG